MSEKHKHSVVTKDPKPGRKPYHTPTFRSEKVFETMALTCGKISTTQGTCKLNKKNS